MRFLKRFPKEKHDQIRQVMSYIEMCGLTGKDLVSIGGWIDRTRKTEEAQVALQRIADLDPRPIGNDAKLPKWTWWHERWYVDRPQGRYHFHEDGWYSWRITNTRTKVTQTYHATVRDWPANWSWTRRSAHDIMLDIADGKITLNW